MGKYHNSIDAKARMIIPAKHRDELGYRCVLTIGEDRCLNIYSLAEWESYTQKLASLPTSDLASRQFMRNVYSNANECEIDKQGRIVIPQELREYAKIEKELVTVGVLNKLEVWSKAEWENTANAALLSPSEVAQKMKEYGI